MKDRLDQALVTRGLVVTRSQAESYVRLKLIKVNGVLAKKPGQMVGETDRLELLAKEIYVSRAGLKLASVVQALKLNFTDQVVLDVGSSTGGFTDYALQNGAKKVIAVEAGTDQLHPSLHNNPKIELHEKTDIRDFKTDQKVDMVLIDVSFVSLQAILPSVLTLCNKNTKVVAMAKPQFEANNQAQKHKGVIKNDAIRRDILKNLEVWIQELFMVVDKRDSDVAGAKGNTERFYLLKPSYK